MLKAAVFDDEYIVLQGLREMIDWSSYGIELIGTADNGLSALELFREHQPELIFTDIRMPGMDGLELIEEILREAPETLCIVFSGFNEFEYVKKAINLGVADYLEKPITIPTIEKAIRKAMDTISRQQEVAALKSKVSSSHRGLLEKATLDLLFIGDEGVAKWREIYGAKAEEIAGVTVMASNSDLPSAQEHADYEAIAFRHGEERYVVFAHFRLPAPEFWETLLLSAEQADITVGCGRTYTQLKDAALSCKEALQTLRSAHVLGERGIIRSDAREQPKISSVTHARAYMEQHYTRDVTLQEVAEHVGMNPTYFSVLFKEEVGESYIKYLTRIRMELAKTLLSRGLRVNDVSEKVGYHTYRHFSEVFKKYTGVTPGQYKDQLPDFAGN
ncbi:response regulator [Paenibacillus aceris]|uniref:Two-component system response regulator YesN n=1 Tax=Paenibacillus aceris TaxID=869555 RepID=A0ABS4I3J1_9BACL|nr:response regulator [Paenibacillus aceris]MBP1965474.1 two-component system response regulator YesN [Paenibacillus aceris]NHW33476.1 response regulator [Paenibacillus aceris]